MCIKDKFKWFAIMPFSYTCFFIILFILTVVNSHFYPYLLFYLQFFSRPVDALLGVVLQFSNIPIFGSIFYLFIEISSILSSFIYSLFSENISTVLTPFFYSVIFYLLIGLLFDFLLIRKRDSAEKKK